MPCASSLASPGHGSCRCSTDPPALGISSTVRHTVTPILAASHYVCSLFGLSYESVGEVNQRFMQSQLGGAYGGLLGGLGALLGGLGGPAGLAGGAPPQQQRWERDPSAAAQQVRRVYGHKQKLAAWLAGPAAEGGEALLDGIAALCQDQVSSAPNWPPAKAAPALRTLLDHSTAQRALAAADEGEGGGPITDALVACAWAGRGDLLDLLLSAGVRITVHTLAAAFPLRLGPAAFPGHFAPKLVAPERCDPLRAVRLLLARGRPPVPACPVPHWHPMLRLVGDFKAERGEFGILVSFERWRSARSWLVGEGVAGWVGRWPPDQISEEQEGPWLIHSDSVCIPAARSVNRPAQVRGS